MDFFEEKELSEEWKTRLGIPEDFIPTLLDIVEQGFVTCEDKTDCLSAAISSDCCRCVRSVFPSPDSYALYLKLREAYMPIYIINQIRRMTDG
jgi:hypothetical protein